MLDRPHGKLVRASNEGERMKTISVYLQCPTCKRMADFRRTEEGFNSITIHHYCCWCNSKAETVLKINPQPDSRHVAKGE